MKANQKNSIADYRAAMDKAMANYQQVRIYGGCARIYLQASGKEAAAELKEIAAKLGKQYQKRGPYGLDNVMYMGYDGGAHKLYSQAEAVAAAWREMGLKVYVEAGED